MREHFSKFSRIILLPRGAVCGAAVLPEPHVYLQFSSLIDFYLREISLDLGFITFPHLGHPLQLLRQQHARRVDERRRVDAYQWVERLSGLIVFR